MTVTKITLNFEFNQLVRTFSIKRNNKLQVLENIKHYR